MILATNSFITALLICMAGVAGDPTLSPPQQWPPQPPARITHSESCPVSCSPCDTALERALAWLASQLAARPLPLASEADKKATATIVPQVAGGQVVFALGGLAFELAPHPEQFEKARSHIRRALDAAVPELSVRRPWLCGFLALYLAERKARGEDTTEVLHLLVSYLEQDQNDEGGFGHGLPLYGGPTYARTLIATTNWCAAALGLARRAGLEPSETTIKRVLELYRDVQAPSGALPYGGPRFRRVYEAGRTAGTVFALRALDEEEDPVFLKALDYVRHHLAEIPEGHVDPHQHLLAAALAFRSIGRADWLRFRGSWIDALLGQQAADGSFHCARELWCFPCTDPQMGEWGPVYATASTACILGLGRSRLLEQIRTTPPPVWTRQLDALVSFTVDESNVYTVLAPFTCRALAGADGHPLWEALLSKDSTSSVDPSGIWADGKRVVVELRNTQRYGVQRGPHGKRLSEGTWAHALICLDATSGEVLWEQRRSSTGRALAIVFLPHEIAMFARDGTLEVRNRETGELIWERDLLDQSTMSTPYVGMVPGTADALVVYVDSHLWVLAHDGALLWSTSMSEPDVTISSVAGVTEGIVAGAGDGSVSCWRATDGSLLWREPLDAAVDGLFTSIDGQSVIVTTQDTGVHCLATSDGSELWSFHPPLSIEHRALQTFAVNTTPTMVWVQELRDEMMFGLSARDGSVREVLFNVDSRRGTPRWTVQGESLLVQTGASLALVKPVTRMRD